jgi:HEAT repeat protein
MTRPILSILAIFTLFIWVSFSQAAPISGKEAERQKVVLEQLKKYLNEEKKVAAKFTLIEKIMKQEENTDLRRKMLEMATNIPGEEIEPFLQSLLVSEKDARIRSQIATLLGQRGSAKSLSSLLDCAAKDKTTEYQIGDIAGRGNARRSGIFAIAELAIRHRQIAGEATAKLRELKLDPEEKETDQLTDARIQALFQITRDKVLLKPFYERLQSREAKERESGVIAFRFLKLQVAPKELTETLKDSSTGVRQWTALVLGEIGDPKTGEILMASASDRKEDIGVRCNSIYALGRMKIAAAKDTLEKLLDEEEPRISTQAAIAYYRITGKKTKQFPEGYKAD